MYKIPGCTLKAKIFESSNTLIFRGTRQRDDYPIVLKILKEDYPSPEELVRYRQEFEITRNLDFPGVIKAYSQEKYGNTLAIILEDFGGESLQILNQQRPFSITEVLKLVIRISEILGDIHGAQIIHKDLNPSNIIYNAESNVLKLIDFGISSHLARERTSLKNPERLEGTLAYMSPEQTGRMNRTLDYRTDYYALGATLYELLTGQLPFPVQDPLELAHSHLAREPTAPDSLNPKIPKNLSRVTLKLLAKRAEDRYQTNRGLVADLEFCLDELEGNSSGAPFKPGVRDVSAHFQLPQKLYGRESELETLLKTAKRAAEGESEALFVAGYSGVGKSALVKELYRTLIRPGVGNGYFIAGKFDQYHHNIPYSAAQAAFRDLIRQLLTENEARLSGWKNKILSALGPNGRLITDFLPELELIIGEQTPVPELDLAANRNRFKLELQKFVNVFLQPEHPLVLFLDDLQWADRASLDLITLMMTNTRYLFLIGAYRDNEIHPGHTLLLTLEEIRKAGGALDSIALLPLELEDIRRYIADATQREPADTEDLADLVERKTAGNPFFLGEFLKRIKRESLLTFDESRAVWVWDMRGIQEQNISENVVELIADQVTVLNNDTKLALTRAACLGNTFDLETLALLHDKSPAETAGDLWPALELNMLLPLRDEYKIAALKPLDIPLHENQAKLLYKFAHDRIEEASYNLISKEERQILHLKVGRFLLREVSEEAYNPQLFTIVDHLNLGQEGISDPGERDRLARLNFQAGSRAQTSTAYRAALTYYKTSLNLLKVTDSSPWRRNYEMTLALTTRASEVAMLIGDYVEMATFTEKALQKATNIQDSAKIFEVQIMAAMAQNDGPQAINIALFALKKLGFRLPNKPGKFRTLAVLLRTKLRLAGKTPEDILSLPEMQDPAARAASRILEKTSGAAYFNAPDLLALIIFQKIKISLKYGNSHETPTFYGAYGLLFITVLGDIETGYQYGELSLQLMQHLGLMESRAKVMYVFNYFIRPRKKALRESILPFLEIHKLALEMGDLEIAAYSLLVSSGCSYSCGGELERLEKDMAIQARIITGLGQKTVLGYLNIYRQGIQNLRKETVDQTLLIGDIYNENILLPIHEKTEDKGALIIYYSWKLQLSFLFQKPPEPAIQYAYTGVKYLKSSQGTPGETTFLLFDSLARLAFFSSAPKTERKRIAKKVKANQKLFNKWAEHAPMNHLHNYLLVAAEEARVFNRPEIARELYDQAIKSARENEYINIEALAWELAGRFYLKQGPDYSARFYLKNAHYAYSLWGGSGESPSSGKISSRDFWCKISAQKRYNLHFQHQPDRLHFPGTGRHSQSFAGHHRRNSHRCSD